MRQSQKHAAKVLKAATFRAGLPSLSFHDLRHTHALALLGAGEPVPVVAQRLGRANSAATMRIYAHMIPGSERGPSDTRPPCTVRFPSWRRATTGRIWANLNTVLFTIYLKPKSCKALGV
jgi:hypothetical protein